MVKSMNGFAAVTREDARATLPRAIRGPTHRYLGGQLVLPPALAPVVCDLRAVVAKRIERGRIEISVTVQMRQGQAVEVEFNEEFGRALAAALDEARARGLVAGALAPGDLLRMPQAITI